MSGEFKPEEYINKFDNYCSGYLYTIVEKEGMMGGTDIEAIKKIAQLTKNELTNKVTVDKKGTGIETAFTPIEILKGNMTYLEVELITGKTHQIRAHLASIRHPLIGDFKYGNEKVNREMNQKYGLKHQLLHAYRMEFPKLEGDLAELSGKVITAPLPKQFEKILEDVK